MSKSSLLLALLTSLSIALPVHASDRYKSRPPVMVSPDLQASWILQLGGVPAQTRSYATPQRMRHGTAFSVPAALLENLRKAIPRPG